MAEAVAVAASVIAIVQITDTIIGYCRHYIGATKDAPSDLREILLEVSTLRAILQNLQFLSENSPNSNPPSHWGGGESIEGCHRAIKELEKLFPSESSDENSQEEHRSKKRRVKASLTTLAWPLKQTRARKLLDEINRYKTTISLALTTNFAQDIKEVKAKATEVHEMLTVNQRREVLSWLVSTNPQSLHERACSQIESGTCEWMARSSQWKSWLERKDRCLWIHGIPGAGKTVLMAYLEQLAEKPIRSKKHAFTYYYCYFGHNQDEAPAFLRWNLYSLCERASVVPSAVYKLYKRGTEPNLAELMDALEAILNEFDVVYVFIDALDESNPREGLLKVIRNLVLDPKFGRLQIMASSREYFDIERAMQNISLCVSMSNPSVERDIRRVIHSMLHSNPKFRRWSDNLLDEVEDAIEMGAKGMFRWAICQVDVVRRLKSDSNIVRKQLANLPKTLFETYDKIFLSIPEEERLFALHTLCWMVFHQNVHGDENKIPSSMLIQAAAQSTLQKDRFYDNEELREILGCLIRVTTENKSCNGQASHESETAHTMSCVVFAHFTVREYLDSGRSLPTLNVSSDDMCDNFEYMMMGEVEKVGPHESWDLDSSTIFHAAEQNFRSYCILSVLQIDSGRHGYGDWLFDSDVAALALFPFDTTLLH